MERLHLQVRVARSPELAAHDITLATRALEAGDHAEAQRLYAGMASVALHHSISWGNLSALALGLGDLAAAQRHAARALAMDEANADAWVNLGAARWDAGLRQEAAQATQRALQLASGHEAAALNLALMLRAAGHVDIARGLLDRASAASPRSWRLAQALAEVARLQMDHAVARSAILQALPGRLAQCDLRQPARSGLRPGTGADVRTALAASCDRLDALGVEYHLMAGTLLAIVKDGRLFAHDKDVDLALPDLAPDQREAVHSAFAADADYRMFPPPPLATGQAASVIGLVHAPTGVGIDLILPQRDPDGRMRNNMGWPDQLASVLRPYRIGTMQWDGRDWPVPEPTGQYLEDMYGPDWRDQLHTAAGVTYDRCYSDTMVSNPSRTAESTPRAVTLGLIRLVRILGSNEWPKAVAYCAQLLAREDIPQVRTALAKLQGAGHSGLRFDG